MGTLSDWLLPVLLFGFAGLLAIHEWQLFRETKDSDGDLFRYSRRRLRRRLIGLVDLAAFALTLLFWQLWPPRSARGASSFLSIFGLEVIVLVTIAVFDLLETSKGARPGGFSPQGRSGSAPTE
jgi:hypothetical protein